MNWTDLLTNRTVQNHTTSIEEINNLREIVKRDLLDASIAGLSADRRFATAYNAVLQLSKMAISCAGYRISTSVGHHFRTFEVVKIALGTPSDTFTRYFEMCRRKRNNIDYDSAEVVSETEAAELLQKAKEFQILIEDWIRINHPNFDV